MQNLLALLLLLITATAAVPSPPDGPVLTVKHHENNHLTFVGIGCQVYIYNGTTVVANTNKLISNSLCLNVAGIGLSTNGSKALITLSGSNQMYLIVLQENITLSGGIHINIDVIKLAKPIGFSSLGRVQNSIVGNTTTMSNMFFIAANRVNESGAIVSFEVGDFIGVKSILYIPSSNVNDVRPIVSKSLSSTLFLVSANKGLYKIMWNGVKLSMEGMLIPTDPGNDGLDVGINLHTAYIAAQGSGLRIADLQKKSIVGSIKVNGWAGGVRVVTSTAGNIKRMAYVAADPGLIAFDVSIDDTPKLLWTCTLTKGLGWNLDVHVHKQVSVIYLADNKGGVFVIKHHLENKNQLPDVISHVGSGVFQQCSNIS